MSKVLTVGIIGAGWPGSAHAKGYQLAGGFKLAAVADLIPERRNKLAAEFQIPKIYENADAVLKDRSLDVVSLCVPTDLHAEMAIKAMRYGKHVICETPPAQNAKSARTIERAAERYKRVVMYALQRRFGPGELAAHQAIAKGYAGEIFHARAAWMRSKGIPVGTGWYTDKAKSGGGALIDLGVHMLDTAWHLMGNPAPQSAFAVTHPADREVEEIGYALIRFEGGKSLELSASWAIAQPPSQNGTVLRLHGTGGAVDVYTAQGAVLYRQDKETILPPPKLIHHAAMMRHFKTAISGGITAQASGAHGVALMKIVEAIYRSAQTGRSVEIKHKEPQAAQV